MKRLKGLLEDNLDNMAQAISDKTAMRKDFIRKWIDKNKLDFSALNDLMAKVSKKKKYIDLAMAIMNGKVPKV